MIITAEVASAAICVGSSIGNAKLKRATTNLYGNGSIVDSVGDISNAPSGAAHKFGRGKEIDISISEIDNGHQWIRLHKLEKRYLGDLEDSRETGYALIALNSNMLSIMYFLPGSIADRASVFGLWYDIFKLSVTSYRNLTFGAHFFGFRGFDNDRPEAAMFLTEDEFVSGVPLIASNDLRIALRSGNVTV